MQILSTIIRHRSITAAAQILAVSQPTLSRQLQHAEDKLGYPLFLREKGRLEPTREALRLFDEIVRVEAQIQGVRTLARELARGDAGLLRIGTSSSLSLTIFPEAIRRFYERFPGIKIVAHARPIAQLEELLVTREVDFALALTPFRIPNASVVSLGTVEMVCVMASGHPLAARDLVSAEDIGRYDFISFGSDTYFGQVLDSFFKSSGTYRRLAIEVWSSMLAVPLVRASSAVAIVDELLARQFPDGLVSRRLTPRVVLNVTGAVASTAPPTGTVREFIRCVEEVLNGPAPRND